MGFLKSVCAKVHTNKLYACRPKSNRTGDIIYMYMWNGMNINGEMYFLKVQLIVD